MKSITTLKEVLKDCLKNISEQPRQILGRLKEFFDKPAPPPAEVIAKNVRVILFQYDKDWLPPQVDEKEEQDSDSDDDDDDNAEEVKEAEQEDEEQQDWDDYGMSK